MKKTSVLLLILDLIFLIIFNALFFVLGGTTHNAPVWLSYGFIHFAYVLLVLTPLLIREGKSKAVFGFSIYSISSGYFFVELLTGIVFILVSPDSYKAVFLVQLCIAGIYAILLIAHIIANEHTAEAEERRENEIAYVKAASAKLKSLAGNISDREARKRVENVYDAVYSSPVKSHPKLAQMENRILLSISELEDAVSAGNNEGIITLADELLNAVNERNMRLKMMN